jgi:Na+(H+)/acetate symporter ActP
MIDPGAAALALLAVVLGAFGLVIATRPRRDTTLDFYLAGRRVGIVTNACAMCGDYFSASPRRCTRPGSTACGMRPASPPGS